MGRSSTPGTMPPAFSLLPSPCGQSLALFFVHLLREPLPWLQPHHPSVTGGPFLRQGNEGGPAESAAGMLGAPRQEPTGRNPWAQGASLVVPAPVTLG
jgi:hypothetical protein